MKLHGKSALVSGSTLGIGYAIALALAREGARVMINGRTEARVNDAIHRIIQAVPAAHVQGVVADLGTKEGAKKLFDQVKEVDILVNNLGIFEPKPFFEIPDEDWDRFFQINVMSAVRLSRHYVPAMVKKKWGRVIFISSEAAVHIPTEMIHYGMTKTALVAIARGLAETVGPNVTVNSVLVGPTKSEGVASFIENWSSQENQSPDDFEKEFFKTARSSSILKRFIRPEEVASMVAYLVSPEASATTGAAVRVDGGMVRAIL